MHTIIKIAAVSVLSLFAIERMVSISNAEETDIECGGIGKDEYRWKRCEIWTQDFRNRAYGWDCVFCNDNFKHRLFLSL